MQQTFKSEFERLLPIQFPVWTGLRVMMLPFRLDDLSTLPDALDNWAPGIEQLCDLSPQKTGVAYLTIDEKTLKPGETHRRPGIHIDGSEIGGWGGGRPWAKNGMILASTPAGCRAWNQEFEGVPGEEGDCEHLRSQCNDGEVMQEGVAYWCTGLCVHESLPMEKETRRSLVRLSMPSDAPWYEGYTKNPKGVLPTGPVLGRRRFQTEPEVVLL